MADQLPITIQLRKENKQLVIVNEMSLAIQTIIEIGDIVGFNLH